MKQFLEKCKQFVQTKKGRYILIAGAVSFVALLFLLSSGGDRVPSARKLAKLNEDNIDKIFDKTIRDFRGHLIDNLDDQKDTNFIVYSKGVQRIEANEKKNIILSANNASMEYVISKPSKEIRKLEQGDIFFIEPSEAYPPGIVVKVWEITANRKQATIKGTSMQLEELIEYADVDMEFSIDQVYFEDNGLPYSATFEEYTDNEQEIWDAEEVAAANLGISDKEMTAFPMQPVPLSGNAGTVSSDSPKFSWMTNTIVDKTIPVCLNISTQIEGHINNVGVKGTLGAKIKGIHVVLKVHPLYATVESSVSVLARPYVDGMLGVTGSFYHAFGLPKMFVPVFGPFCLGYSLSPSISVNGYINGRLSMATDVEIGAGSKIIAGVYNQPNMILNGPDNYAAKMNLVEASVDVDLNLLDAYVGFGVPVITELYASMSGGLAIDGVMEFPDLSFTSENGEKIHDCDACVDGDIGLEARSTVGWTGLVVFKKFFPDRAFHVGVEKKLFEVNLPLNDFYVSYRNNNHTGEQDIECDMGVCPYKGTPVIVKITSTIGREDVSLSNFVVKVDDGKTILETVLTDENGEAHFVLPEGDYKLKVEHGFFDYNDTIRVSDAKVVKEIEVDIKPNIFVMLHPIEPEFEATAPIRKVTGSHPYTLLIMDSEHRSGSWIDELLLAGAKPGDIVVWMTWDQTRGDVFEAGQNWEFTQFLLGHVTINIGRIFYTYQGLEADGSERAPDLELHWWLTSYNNFANNNSLVHMVKVENEDYDDAPYFENLRCRSSITINHGDLPYDAAYAVTRTGQTSSFYEPIEHLGGTSFWECFATLSSFRSRLDTMAGQYQEYLEAALSNQDFTDMSPDIE